MIETLESRTLLAASPTVRVPKDLGPGTVTLRDHVIYVVGLTDEPNLVAIYLSTMPKLENINVVTRFGVSGVVDPKVEQFATHVVHRVVVAGGNQKDRVTVGSVPDGFEPGEMPPGEKAPASEIASVTQDASFDGHATSFKDRLDGFPYLLPKRVRTEIDGKDGDDVLIGGRGRDRILGDIGNDWLVGQAGIDYVDAGDGADRLEGGPGADKLFGRDGDDSFNLDRGSQRQDIIHGGPGQDIIEFARGLRLRDRLGDDILQDVQP